MENEIKFIEQSRRKMSGYATIDIENLAEQLKESANPVLFQYFNHLKDRAILINDYISQDSIEYIVMPIIQWNKEDKNIEPKDKKPITIYLNTNGGSSAIGNTIISYIVGSKTPINIVVLSYAMSMGANILMGSHKNPLVTRYCNPYSIGLIHSGYDSIEGTPEQIEAYQNFNKKTLDKQCQDMILQYSKISEKEYKNKKSKEWYLSAEDMLKYGLVDFITEEII